MFIAAIWEWYFQHFNLFNNKTVLQNVMMAPEYLQMQGSEESKKERTAGFSSKNVFRGKDKKKKLLFRSLRQRNRSKRSQGECQAFTRIGLEDKADVYPSTLSGGQKQRVAIIRSLCDESGCDPF